MSLQQESDSYTFHFPTDLERIIFDHAAYRDRKTALQLIRVAKCVCYWIEPLIYEVIPMKRMQDFMKSLADSSTAKSIDFYAAHVKFLGLTLDVYPIPASTLSTMLPSFTSLESIALWRREIRGEEIGLLHSAGNVRPKRLSCYVEDFLGIKDISHLHSDFDFGDPFFSRLTHLEVLDSCQTWTVWEGLKSLPCLTHLSFSDDINEIIEYNIDGEADLIKAFIPRILKECSTLEVVIFFRWEPFSGNAAALDAIMAPHKDARCVFIPSPDSWEDREAHFYGESDLWSRAEQRVREQRRIFEGGGEKYIT